MVYYYFKEGEGIMETRTKPNVTYIELKRALPIPNKEGYNAILKTDFENNKVWYELVETDLHKKQVEIEQIKKQLEDWDYKTSKYVDGEYTEEEWTTIVEQRKAWRDRINELEESL